MSSSIVVAKNGESIKLEMPDNTQDIDSLKGVQTELVSDVVSLESRIAALEKDLQDLVDAVNEDPEPEPDPIPFPGESLDPSVTYWESSSDNQVLYLQPGTYHTQFYVFHNNVSILGVPDEDGNLPVVDGRVDLGLTWTDHGDRLYSAVLPAMPDLWHFVDGHPDGLSRNHDVVHPLLCTIGDSPMTYNPTDDYVSIEENEFALNAPAGVAGLIYIRLGVNQSTEGFLLSDKPWLFEGDPNITGLTLINTTFQFCSNTGKIGMVNSPGIGGLMENVHARYANTIGFKYGSRESIHSKGNLLQPAVGYTYKNVTANYNGQSGFWGKLKNTLVENWDNNYNGWKGGHPWWEVSYKLIESSHVTLRNGRTIGNEGAGFWPDIWNTDITVEGLLAEDNLFCNVLLEHGLHRFTGTDITCNSPRSFEGVAAGVILQSNIEDCSIDNLRITGGEDGIRLNHADPRGSIKNNVITGYTHDGVQNPIRQIGSGDGSNTIVEE